MSATTAALIQVFAGSVVTGVGVAYIVYVTGLADPIVTAVRHPLRTFEIIVAALILANLPAPRIKSYKGRHCDTFAIPVCRTAA